MLGSKRSDVGIALAILRLVKRGERKTRIMYGANLSYEMLTRYLDFLLQREFIRAEADGAYALTDRGLALMLDLERVHRHFEDAEARLAERPAVRPA